MWIGWTHTVVRIAVTAFRVVEEFDVVEDVTARFFPVDIGFAADPFALE